MTAMYQIKNKASNFFYRHKKKMIVIVPLLILLVLVVLQKIFEVPPYDMRIVTVLSEDSIDADWYREALEMFADDSDGNGEVSVRFDVYHIDPDDNEVKYKSDRAVLVGHLQDTDFSCCLVDEKTYEELKSANQGYLYDISKIFPNNPNIEGDRCFVKGTLLGEELEGTKIPEGLSLVMRDRNYLGVSLTLYMEYLFRILGEDYIGVS